MNDTRSLLMCPTREELFARDIDAEAMELEREARVQRLRMYVIARIWKNFQQHTERVCRFLERSFEIFMPHRHNPYNLAPEKIPKSVAEMNAELGDHYYL